MSVTLAANINASTKRLTLSAEIADLLPEHYLRIADEIVQFLGYQTPRNPRLLDAKKVVALRGMLGTTAVSHLAGAAVLGVAESVVTGDDEDEPEPFSSGGGGVTVDNGSDPPTTVTTLLAHGALIDGSEADLFGNGIALVLDSNLIQQAAISARVDGEEVFAVGPDGRMWLTYRGATLGGVQVIVADDIDHDRLRIEDDSGASGFYVRATGKVQIIPASGATDHMLEVWDAGGNNRIFTVDTDGSVHIKTGTTIQADL